MDGDLIRARNILGIYISLTIGLLALFIFNELATDDLATAIFLRSSLVSVPLLLLVIASLSSCWMGQTCDYKLHGVLYSSGANMAGVILLGLGLAVIEYDIFPFIIQIVFSSVIVCVLSSLIGSYGRNNAFAKTSDLDEDDYFTPRIEPPQRSVPAAYEENGYEWLHLDDGTTWYRVGGGFPDPNNWELYKAS